MSLYSLLHGMTPLHMICHLSGIICWNTPWFHIDVDLIHLLWLAFFHKNFQWCYKSLLNYHIWHNQHWPTILAFHPCNLPTVSSFLLFFSSSLFTYLFSLFLLLGLFVCSSLTLFFSPVCTLERLYLTQIAVSEGNLYWWTLVDDFLSQISC